MMGERETILEAAAANRITGQRESGKMMQTWITLVEQLKETARGFPLAEPELSFLGLLNQRVEKTSITASYLFGERGF